MSAISRAINFYKGIVLIMMGLFIALIAYTQRDVPIEYSPFEFLFILLAIWFIVIGISLMVESK